MSRIRKHNITAGLGNLLEWYDFALYGYFADTIGKLFFPTLGTESLLASLGVFAAGFLSRPFGAYLFGSIGDYYGRRWVLQLVLPCMFLATLSMGLLPTYQEVGWLAPMLLIIVRIIQGLSVGGQFMGTVTYLAEFLEEGDGKALSLSYALVFSNIGFILASLVAYGYLHFFQDMVPDYWQWRIPFLSSIFTFIFMFWRVRRLPETPEFLDVKKVPFNTEQKNLLQLLKRFPKAIVCTLIATGPVMVSYYLLFVYLISYLTEQGGMSQQEAIVINSVGLIVQTFATPFVAWISDVYGHKRTSYIAFVLLSLGIYAGFNLFQYHQFWINVVVLSLLGLISMGFTAPILVLIVEAYPTEFRLRGSALSYNVAAAVSGGTTPALLSWLALIGDAVLSPAYYMIAWSILGGIGIYFIRKSEQ